MAQQAADVHALVVGRTIAQLRERRGWSQAHLAEAAGITQPTLSRIERGQASPDPFACRRLAEVLGVSSTDLTRVIEDAFLRTEHAVFSVSRKPSSNTWATALAVAGIAGLLGIVSIAVSFALSDDQEERPPGRTRPT